MSESSKLAKNTVLITGSKTSALLSMIILLPVMTARLSGGDYGLLDLAFSYGGLLTPLLTLALDGGTFRFLIEHRSNDANQAKVISTVIFTVLPLILITLIVAIFAANIFEAEIVIWFAFYFVAISISSVTANVLRGFGHTTTYAVAMILQNVLTIIGVLLALTIFNSGLLGVLVTYVLANAAASCFHVFMSKTHRFIKPQHFDRRMLRELLTYSLPSIPNSISWWVINVSDRTIITLAISLWANGIYAVANKFGSLIAVAQGIFFMSWAESAALNFHKERQGRDKFFSSVFNRQLAVFGAASILLIA